MRRRAGVTGPAGGGGPCAAPPADTLRGGRRSAPEAGIRDRRRGQAEAERRQALWLAEEGSPAKRRDERVADYRARLQSLIRRCPHYTVVAAAGHPALGIVKTLVEGNPSGRRFRAHRYGPDFDEPCYFDEVEEACMWVARGLPSKLL
jgi:hypothetical protein